MLELRLLRQEQYKQVAEWEWGKQENVDWPRYYAEMNAPGWAHYGLYDGPIFVGCISLEQITSQMVAFDIVTARRKVNSQDLAQVLLKTAGELFSQGFTALVACIPREKRAAAILALRCQMKERASTSFARYFILTKFRFDRI